MLVFLFVEFVEVFHILPASELLKHNHFILAVLRRLGEQVFFLVFLCHVNNVGPVFLVLCLKVSQEVVEALVTFGHALN